MSDYWWGRPIGEPVPHIRMPRRIFVDRGVMVIPAGTSSRDAVFAVLDALGDGEQFVIRDERRPARRGTP
jgi:hypothetical protein